MTRTSSTRCAKIALQQPALADGTTGDVRASAVPLDRPVNAKDLLAYQRARETLDFSTGAFLPEPATGKPGFNLTQPVIDQSGALAFVLWASLDLEWVAGFIERSGLPANTVLTVLDRDGRVQYRSVDMEHVRGQAGGSYAAAARGRNGADHHDGP